MEIKETKNLFQGNAEKEILNRLEKLEPNAKRLWGKMEITQMLAHCSEWLEIASGSKNPPRVFIGRILGPLFKSNFYNEKPLEKNGPTDKSTIELPKGSFVDEKERLKKLITQFYKGNKANCTIQPHPFFGKLTPEQWSIGMYKHLDHHLRQFGA